MATWAQRCVAGMALAAIAGSGAAQESTNHVAEETDWSVFVETDPRECWAVSAPKETVHTRDGRVVSVRRGDIFLVMTFRGGGDGNGEVSYFSGYPYAEGATVEVEIGSDSFQMFTDNRTVSDGTTGVAWVLPEDDANILAAMRRGAEAVVTGVSSRGTQTQDTFSLFGFTAASEEAQRRCRD